MTTLYRLRPERWPQVGLKGFFVLVTVLGAAVGWLSVQLKWIRERHAVLEQLETRSGYYAQAFRYSVDPSANLPLGLRLLREPSVAVVSLFTTPEEHESLIPQLQRLFPEAEMNEAIDWYGQRAWGRDVLPADSNPIYVHPPR